MILTDRGTLKTGVMAVEILDLPSQINSCHFKIH